LDRFAERFHLSDDEVADDATVFFLRFTEQRHRRVIHLPWSNIHSARLTFERTLTATHCCTAIIQLLAWPSWHLQTAPESSQQHRRREGVQAYLKR